MNVQVEISTYGNLSFVNAPYVEFEEKIHKRHKDTTILIGLETASRTVFAVFKPQY